jgi:hypothetical protein
MHHRYRHLALLCAGICALPTAALAQSSGGTKFGDPAATAPAALPAHDAVLLGHTMHVRGTLSGAAGQTVVVERREAGGAWQQAATAVAGDDSSFDASWKTDHIGHFDLRARLAASDGGDGAAAAAALPTSAITVFRSTVVTWFGPGFYGHRTACGGTLGTGTLGVANKTLPCGTRVTLHYRSSTVTVPVIDRGPYAAGREYDLTGATKNRLHFGSTGTLWSAPHRH